MKRKHSFISTLSSLMVAIFMIAVVVPVSHLDSVAAAPFHEAILIVIGATHGGATTVDITTVVTAM